MAAVVLYPSLVAAIQRAGFGGGIGFGDTAFLDPLADQVHFTFVFIGGGDDFRWRIQSLGLAFNATLHCPSEDAGVFVPQFFWQVFVALFWRDGDGEWHQPDASPDGVVVATDDGLMVCTQPDFEIGDELKILGEQKARCDYIAAG
jgi:hypothetical protein